MTRAAHRPASPLPPHPRRSSTDFMNELHGLAGEWEWEASRLELLATGQPDDTRAAWLDQALLLKTCAEQLVDVVWADVPHPLPTPGMLRAHLVREE